MAFELFRDQVQPLSSTYNGKWEKCTFEFTTMPEQIPGEGWLADNLVQKTIEELTTQGCRLLHIKIYRDTAPMLTTKYRVEIWTTASPIFWGILIIGILAVLALVLTWKIIEEIKGTNWGSIPASITWGLPILAGGVLFLVIYKQMKKPREVT
jgi:hypothetical protein